MPDNLANTADGACLGGADLIFAMLVFGPLVLLWLMLLDEDSVAGSADVECVWFGD
jgi:hypothetical protein